MNALARLFILLLLLAATGCKVSLTALTCPEQGGPVWRELTVPHFVVSTDLPLETARKTAIDLETSYVALAAALGVTEPPTARRERRIIFARRKDFQALNDVPNVWSYSWTMLSDDIEFQPTTFNYHLDIPLARRLAQSAIARHLLHRHAWKLPWWLETGLVESLSTVRVERGVALIGERPVDADYWDGPLHSLDAHLEGLDFYNYRLPAANAPSLAKLMALDHSPSGFDEGVLHEVATAKLIQVLEGRADPRHAPAFARMREALMRGTPASQAFSEAYPGMTLGDFEAEYRKYLLDPGEHVTRVELAGFAVIDPVVVPVTDVDVHVLWALATRGFAAEEAQIARALEEWPGNATLRFARAAMRARQGDLRGAESDLWSVPEAERATVRYLFISLYTALDRLEAEKDPEARKVRLTRIGMLVDKLLPLATTPAQQSFSALALAELQRNDEAAALTRKVVEADPFCGECFEIRAKVLLAAGQLPAAGQAAERALTLLADREGTRASLDLYHRIEHEAAKQGHP